MGAGCCLSFLLPFLPSCCLALLLSKGCLQRGWCGGVLLPGSAAAPGNKPVGDVCH